VGDELGTLFEPNLRIQKSNFLKKVEFQKPAGKKNHHTPLASLTKNKPKSRLRAKREKKVFGWNIEGKFK